MIDLTLIIIIALAFASIVLWVVTKLLKKGIEERFQSNPIVSCLDGEHPKSSLFMRVNGCGCTMLGDFRHAQIDDEMTFVSYYFFNLFFIPLIPINCYRVISEDHYEYRFLGLEHMYWKEVLCVYTNSFKWIFSIVSIIMLLILIMG